MAYIEKLMRFLPSIHLGALPRPVQVSPVDGLRYLGATLPPELREGPLRLNKSEAIKPYSSIINFALAIPSAFSLCTASLICLSNNSR